MTPTKTSRISFFASGNPAAQPRARAVRQGRFVRMYTPDTADGWKAAVKAAARTAGAADAKMEGPVSVGLAFYFPRPKAHFLKSGLRANAPREHTAKPDADNLAKAVLDALTDCGAWGDDAQVYDLRATKQYASAESGAGCEITIA